MATISRRDFVKALGASAAFSGLSGQLSWAAPGGETMRPNLLYIMIDDAGYGDLSSYGRPDYQTPNLDALAAQGVRLTDAYAAAPVCTPTRTGFMTGRYPQRTSVGLEEPIAFKQDLGERIGEVGLGPDHPTVASLLKGVGYETALVGKWHLGYEPQFGPRQHGFDEFFGFLSGGVDYYAHTDGDGAPDLWENEMPVAREGYLTDLFAERAVEFVSRPRRAPFFLSLQFNAPHWPWDTPTYDEPAFGSSGDAGGGSLAAYAEMVQNLDTNIGKVLAALKDSDLEDDTLVIFTSDNGGERFSYNWPLTGEKFDLHEGGVRVPAIVRWPGVIPAEQVSSQAAITMDWTATLLAAAGAEADPAYPLDGEDLLPVLTGREFVRERTLGWRLSSTDQGALRQGRWKYLRSGDDEALFDLNADIHEQADCRDLEPVTFAALQSAWASWNETLLPPLAPEVTD